MDTPKPDKLIKLYGQCFSPFMMIGKWALYKGQNNGRFMVKDKRGNWNAEIDAWKDGERWEYIENEAHEKGENTNENT